MFFFVFYQIVFNLISAPGAKKIVSSLILDMDCNALDQVGLSLFTACAHAEQTGQSR